MTTPNVTVNISDPESEFEKQGVTFKIITEDMFPKVCQYVISPKSLLYISTRVKPLLMRLRVL